MTLLEVTLELMRMDADLAVASVGRSDIMFEVDLRNLRNHDLYVKQAAALIDKCDAEVCRQWEESAKLSAKAMEDWHAAQKAKEGK
ncbi:MAG: hypothetical protein QM729_21330 [Solirubrobacterales bacterium]